MSRCKANAASGRRPYNVSPMQHLTPRQIVAELDKYIVGQDDAKRAVAVAVRNRWRRQQLPEEMRQDVAPKNILMIGPTGVGKTEIARRLARLVGAPFIKVEATKYTEVGYHGRDVESMIRDLLDVAIAHGPRGDDRVGQGARGEAGRGAAARSTCCPRGDGTSVPRHDDEEAKARRSARATSSASSSAPASWKTAWSRSPSRSAPTRRRRARAGGHGDGRRVPEHVREDAPHASARRGSSPSRDARKVLFAQEAEKLIDKDKIHRTAIERVEQSGIVFLDEIDKIAGTDSRSTARTSRGRACSATCCRSSRAARSITKYGPVQDRPHPVHRRRRVSREQADAT